MPILIADNWTALREGVVTAENGEQHFTGKIVIIFFLDKKETTHYTGVSKKIDVESTTPGKLTRVQEKDENGRFVTKFVKVLYEHQIVLDRVSKAMGGFSGWTFKMGENVVCLPKGRSETRYETIDVATVGGENKTKSKTVQVKTQSDALLEKIFTVKS